MAKMNVDPECSRAVRRVRDVIEGRLGRDAATVFSEAIANVREHGEAPEAELSLHRDGFEVRNVRHGSFRRETNKPCGEGGYGLQIMERMGGQWHADDGVCSVRWPRRRR